MADTPQTQSFEASFGGKLGLILRAIGVLAAGILLVALLEPARGYALATLAISGFFTVVWLDRFVRAARGPVYRIEDGDFVVPGGLWPARLALDTLREAHFLGSYGAVVLHFVEPSDAQTPDADPADFQSDTSNYADERVTRQKVRLGALKPRDRRALQDAIAERVGQRPTSFHASLGARLRLAVGAAIALAASFWFPVDWLVAQGGAVSHALTQPVHVAAVALQVLVGYLGVRRLAWLARSLAGPVYGLEDGELVAPGFIWEERHRLDRLEDARFTDRRRIDLRFRDSRGVHPEGTAQPTPGERDKNPLIAVLPLAAFDSHPRMTVHLDWLSDADREALCEQIKRHDDE